MANKSCEISILNIPESNLHMVAPMTTLSLTLNVSFSFQPLCVTRLAIWALPGYVYTAFHRQICRCSPCAASWLGDSRCKLDAVQTWARTLLSLNWWALMRAAAWPHASCFTLSSLLSGSQDRRNKCLCTSKILQAHSLSHSPESLSCALPNTLEEELKSDQ